MRFSLIRSRFSAIGRRLKAVLTTGLMVLAVVAAAFGAYAYIAYHDKLATGTGGLGPVTVPLDAAEIISDDGRKR
jgi:hypothetical protein